MKKIVSVLLIALIILTACSPKPKAGEQETPNTVDVSVSALEKAVKEVIESEVISYNFHLSNETNLLSENHLSLNYLNDFPQAKMIKKTLVEGETLAATYINEGYIYYDFPGGQLKEELNQESLEYAYGYVFDVHDVAYQLTALSKIPSFFESKNYTTKAHDGEILYILDKENDNAKSLLDSYELPIDEENEAEKIEYVSFHVKDSKLIGYTIDFRSQQNDFGREEVFILAINDDVVFDFPDFSNYIEISS